jgi:hypothetical protein
MAVRGYILGRMGRRVEVEQLIREYTRVGPKPQSLGTIYVGMGERSKALDQFEQALETERVNLTHVIPQYWVRVLDGEPRFEAIKRKLGLLP